MSRTVAIASGDGITAPLINIVINLQSSAITFNGFGLFQAVGGPKVVTNAPSISGPGAPGSGFNYWILQLDNVTAGPTIKNSTVAMPVADAGKTAIMQVTQGVADTDLSTVATVALINQW